MLDVEILIFLPLLCFIKELCNIGWKVELEMLSQKYFYFSTILNYLHGGRVNSWITHVQMPYKLRFKLEFWIGPTRLMFFSNGITLLQVVLKLWLVTWCPFRVTVDLHGHICNLVLKFQWLCHPCGHMIACQVLNQPTFMDVWNTPLYNSFAEKIYFQCLQYQPIANHSFT